MQSLTMQIKQGKQMRSLMFAILSVVALVFGVATAVAPSAHADDNRGILRPGCTWDAANYWIQRCTVHSDAMQRDMTVLVQAANGNGHAGLYLLDGMRAPETGSDWINLGGAQSVFVDDNITTVWPVGGESSFFTDWDQPATSSTGTKIYKWETFLTSELPAYLQSAFGVSRTDNAIGGVSMGGTAAVNLAAHHPDMFKQVSSFSGYLHTTDPFMALAIRGAMYDVGGYNKDQMWGGPLSPRTYQNDPFLISPALANTQIFISAATGVWNLNDNFFADPVGGLAGISLEAASRINIRLFEAKIRLEGRQPQTYYPMIGIHNWPYWHDALLQARPQILSATGAA